MDLFEKLENDINNLNNNPKRNKLNRIFKKNIKKIKKEFGGIENIYSSGIMSKKYEPNIIEKNKIIKWRINNFLKIKDENKTPYTIILPPPNVTGKLHIGHAWNGSIQDAIIRYKNSRGFDTLFIPSMDHAGIATQAKVENELAKQGINKNDMTDKEFIEKIWSWKHEYATSIRKQWTKLGLLFNFENEKFTLDKSISDAVNKAFIDMYNDGLIYRGTKAINWDCKLKTSLSNIEVTSKTQKSKMYYLKYMIKDSKKSILIATTRVETLFSDVAVAYNPLDKRFKNLSGKFVINPLTKKELPIIKDENIEIDKGTGMMKVSAHAVIDIDIILKNNLKIIECIDEDGKMNENSSNFKGLDRFIAREKIIKQLEKQKVISKIESIENQLNYSQRSNTIVEILVCPQWFVKTKKLAKLVLKNINNRNGVKFSPDRFKDVLITWMEKVEDWNISRQLVWGHRIPVWYKDNEIKVQTKSPGRKWVQDNDVLDTWFSSSLAPFAFLGWPDSQKDVERYYPIDLLVSAYDIIFFWIARMYFNGLYFMKQKPFKNVLVHGLIRDSQGRKMSKSLNNGIDPFEIIEKYGSDSLRWFLLTNSTSGQDLKFSENKLKESWSFNNKIWNIARFIIENNDNRIIVKKEYDHDRWIINKLNILNKKLINSYDKFEFTIIIKDINNFIYNDFSSWYIEISKDKFNKDIAIKVLSDLLIMIYPIIPFITEDIYSRINKRSISDASWPKLRKIGAAHYIDDVVEITKSIREFRVIHGLKKSDIVYYSINKQMIIKLEVLIHKLANAKIKKNKDSLFILTNYKLYISMDDDMKSAETKRYNKELKNLENEILRSKNILSNKKFISNASKEKIKIEKEKYKQYKQKFADLKNTKK